MFEIENVYYEKTINGIAVCGVSKDFKTKCLVLKEEIDGIPVTKIQANAFQNIQVLTKVSVPSSIAVIEASAFRNCMNLQLVTFSRKKTQLPIAIYAGAFQDCKKLRAIKGGARLSLMGSFVFEGCASLENMPTGIHGKIPRMTFTKCPALRTLFLQYVDDLEAGAFDLNNNINTVVVLKEFKHTNSFLKSIKNAKIMCKKTFKMSELAYLGYQVVLYK